MIQELIDAAKPGDTIHVPPGTYSVDAVSGSINLKSGITLDLTQATLVANPNNQIFSIIMRVSDCENVTILGGTIRGERTTHLGSTAAFMGGGGGGVAIWRSKNIKIQGMKISDCFCDGLLVWHSGQVEIANVIADHNRRQGMSLVDSHDVHIHNSQFTHCGGTPPGDGIDIENDLETETCANILVEHCVFLYNEGSGVGVGSPGQYKNIVINPNNDCLFDGKTQPIWTAGNAGSLGTPWWAFLLNRTYGKAPGYAYWGYPRSWRSA